ncbi:ribosomal-processing cysteine protease Prp [Liquorilactobacillus sucicola]|uniref:ribosomal-processing cysteine protease Prp n=1 Tax=Liquorilactobacillus sucicola TaxID=519050 RepID=UPI00054DF6A6|nr:ribosomal-processing cysteine protease Prp [Liquorilactobacillus sucicola]
MIKVRFFKSRQSRYGFEITGHADSGVYGQDIVCAAVSALAISTINGLEKLAHTDPKVDANEEEGGYLRVELNSQELSNSDAQLLLANLELGLQDIEKNYANYIRITE